MSTRSVELIRHPLRVRALEVKAIRRPGPLYGLLTLHGEDLADFETPSPTDHVGLVPPTDRGLVLPEVVDDRLRWPDGERPPMREYTVRRFDPAARELDVRVLLHGNGPLARWAAGAQVGDRVGVTGPRASKIMPDGFANYLLVGDLTAVPAIARWLGVLPDGAMAQVLIAARSDDDVVELKCEQPIWVLWLTNLSLPEAEHLPLALEQLKLYSDDTFAWAAGEAVAMREVRRVLLEEHGLPRENVRVTGYWRREQADFDYDAPLEP
ncbi:MAG: siderophore-interacting protein [Candidatus Limnocylindrales bacterium]